MMSATHDESANIQSKMCAHCFCHSGHEMQAKLEFRVRAELLAVKAPKHRNCTTPSIDPCRKLRRLIKVH